MNTLIWNVRGLGSPHAFHELQRLLAATSPRLVFLCETRLTSRRCNLWRSMLGFSGQLVVDAEGQKGGLVLLWDNATAVTVLSYSPGHIDCEVEAEGKRWQFTGFYGNPATALRKFSWQLLRRIAEMRRHKDIPWLVGGDFNEILQDSEKQGGRTRSLAQMNMFREAIFCCNLHEVAHRDVTHTWFNRREDGDIFERLDRYLGDPRWQEAFPHAKTMALDLFGSDHRPVMCMLEGDGEKVICHGKGRFHFEDKWLLDRQCVPDFACEWTSLAYVGELPNKMKRCQWFLSKWAKGKFDALGKKITKMRKERQKMMGSANGKINAKAIMDISRKIELAVEMEANHWKQRARVNWLANGDRNTSAFHIQASKRRKKDTIKKLRDELGVWRCEEDEEKAGLIQTYFRELFDSSRPTREDINRVVGAVDTSLSQDDVAFLERPYEAREVRKALFDMHPTKAPARMVSMLGSIKGSGRWWGIS